MFVHDLGIIGANTTICFATLEIIKWLGKMRFLDEQSTPCCYDRCSVDGRSLWAVIEGFVRCEGLAARRTRLVVVVGGGGCVHGL